MPSLAAAAIIADILDNTDPDPEIRAWYASRLRDLEKELTVQPTAHDLDALRLEATLRRAVFIVHEGGDTPRQAICASCIAATHDPRATIADIVKRDDSLHCLGCDYHADCTPECRSRSLEEHDAMVAAAEHDLITADGMIGEHKTASDPPFPSGPPDHLAVILDGDRRCSVEGCGLLDEEHLSDSELDLATRLSSAIAYIDAAIPKLNPGQGMSRTRRRATQAWAEIHLLNVRGLLLPEQRRQRMYANPGDIRTAPRSRLILPR